jgi:hypothetical protein
MLIVKDKVNDLEMSEAIYGPNGGNTHDDGVEEYRPDVVSKGSVIERI